MLPSIGPLNNKCVSCQSWCRSCPGVVSGEECPIILAEVEEMDDPMNPRCRICSHFKRDNCPGVGPNDPCILSDIV